MEVAVQTGDRPRQVILYSGLVLKMSKTEALWIGENPSCELNSIGVSCHKQAIKILGVFISNDMDLAIDLNLKERINTLMTLMTLMYYSTVILQKQMLISLSYNLFTRTFLNPG